MRVDSERIRGLRRERAWSLTRLAHRAGVAPATLSRIERGLAANPRSETVHRIAQALGVPPATLADRTTPSAPGRFNSLDDFRRNILGWG